MRHEIVVELARFHDAPEEQVEMWDSALVDYFASDREKFFMFKHGQQRERHLAWFEGYIKSRSLSRTGQQMEGTTS